MKTFITITVTLLLACLIGGAVGFFGGCVQQRILTVVENEKTYRVPQLHGEDIYLKEGELDNVSPLGWAMMLDIVNDEATHEAYARQCKKDPTLAPEVDRLFETKTMIDAAKKQAEKRKRFRQSTVSETP
jgi:hypothetical protein